MAEGDYTLDYAASAVQHLGVGLYKQLPQALAELITNCWDADAQKVDVFLNYTEQTIRIKDNGNGMSHDELNKDFLRVAKNRRVTEKSDLSIGGRKVTGKKGLGKLALFGIANRIRVLSVKNGFKNGFEMKFSVIQSTPEDERYHPKSLFTDVPTSEPNGTEIIIDDLTLKTITPIEILQNSLARRFNKYSTDEFLVTLKDDSDKILVLDETAFEKSICPSNTEFIYRFPNNFDTKSNNVLKELENKNITGVIFTGKTPLRATDQGFSILSRGKLASEQSTRQFSDRANDNFYNYSAGYFDVDFVDDDLKNDYISTDRQSILWNSTDDLIHLRENLNKLVGLAQSKWRSDRSKIKKAKKQDIIKNTSAAESVLNSPNATIHDKKIIDKTADLLENEDVVISDQEKSKIIENTAKLTETYKKDHSVYRELVPSDFVVPNRINSKIRRLREEALNAATDEENPDKFILTQGLLLRAIIDTTSSAVLIKNREEINSLGNIFKNSDGKSDNAVYNIRFGDKYKYLIKYLGAKGKLSNSKSMQTNISNFDRLKVSSNLDQLMHDDARWPPFDTLKDIWNLICPNLIKAFDLL